jgi:hypothetical protein
MSASNYDHTVLLLYCDVYTLTLWHTLTCTLYTHTPGVDLGPILKDATQELALLLRQQSRPLKQAALEALLALLASSATQMDAALLQQVLKEAAQHVSDADLHLAHLALQASHSCFYFKCLQLRMCAVVLAAWRQRHSYAVRRIVAV